MYLRMNIQVINDGMLVPVIRKTASGILEQLEADQESIDKVKLLVTEACTNVIKHAYDGPGIYEIGIEYCIDMVRIIVKDHGKGFNVDELPVPVCGTPQIGGYGISFMQRESDTCVIESSPEDGTTVMMEIPITYRNERVEAKLNDLSFM